MEATHAELPELRPELRLVEGAPSSTGEPQWLIHDPVEGRFVQIDRAAYHVLSRWPACRTVGDVVAQVNAAGRIAVEERDVVDLVGFLQRSSLTVAPAGDGWRHYAATRAARRRSVGEQLLHNYLFFRLPLVQPQRFLTATLPLADVLASRTAAGLIAVLGLAGLYLASRQWDAYLATMPEIFTLAGMAAMAVSLLLVKAAHELGHAYAAVRRGCHVPVMGIAFILLAPLFYTDVTDSWRLKDRRQRLAIDSAGIRVELAIAAVALFAWSFLPEGGLRGIAFNFSAASLIASLAINLNPFMRFDGYYLLSEVSGVDNLQSRAFAVGRWKLRQWLFGLGLPAPEALPVGRMALLAAYAWATWIYRLGIFIAIALIVYHYFFKALGVLLFAVEIGYFIARPVWSEVSVWYAMRDRIARSRRAGLTAAIAAGLMALAVLPWSTGVAIPAVAEMQSVQPVYAPRSGIVRTLHARQGQPVAAGDVLLTLASPDVEHDIGLTRTRLKLARLQLARRVADAVDKEASLVLEQKVASLESRLAGLVREQDELVVRAPFAGTLLEVNPELPAGRWVGPNDLVALIGMGGNVVLRGYVAEADLARIAKGSAGRFIPDQVQRASIDVRVADIALGATASLEIPDLASVHSGAIAVSQDGRGRLVPAASQYQVRLSVAGDMQPYETALRGVAFVEGRAESLLARMWRQTLKVLMREAGA